MSELLSTYMMQNIAFGCPHDPALPLRYTHRNMLSYCKALLPAIFLPLLLGCGQGRVPAAPLTFPLQITDSPEIATGAWTIEGLSAPGVYGIYPIGGFYGALTAQNTSVQGSFGISSSDPSNPYQPSACLGANIYSSSLVNLTGTASNGTLVLDGTLVGGHVHISAQLSADRKSIVSGSYTITGACATTAPLIDGNYNAPITGTYIGQLTDSKTGRLQTVTATLKQATYFTYGGYIPVDGTLTFTGACNSTSTLDGSYVDGYLSLLAGHIGPGPAGDTYFLTEETDIESRTIAVDDWSYNSPTCGAFDGVNQPAPSMYKQ